MISSSIKTLLQALFLQKHFEQSIINILNLGSPKPLTLNPDSWCQSYNIGALIIRIGFGGRLYYTYDRQSPKNSNGKYLGFVFLGRGVKVLAVSRVSLARAASPSSR